VSDPTTAAAVEAVWRLESTRLIAGLMRMVRDIGLAEDLAQDAMVAALAKWPVDGIPANPGAWLMTTAKRRAVDTFRRRERGDRAYRTVAQEVNEIVNEDMILGALDHVEDDVLRLMFVCCHPSLTPEAQTTLTLRLVAGLTAREIARAYLTTEATVAQRLVRAKRTLASVGAALEEPDEAGRSERLGTVLGVIYLLFNEGYAATIGPDWARPALCAEALRVGRILVALVPDHAEARGLLALMELQSSRLTARVGVEGEPVLLADQDRSRWDAGHLARGLRILAQAEALTDDPGPYTLQAAIAGCHARAGSTAETDWVQITVLYQRLAQQTGSAVVELNRAVALGMAYGPAAGLQLVDQLVDLPALRDYHLLPSVRGDLLARLGRNDEARAEFARAAELAGNERERKLLTERARRLGDRPGH
jgi:RNA polymerase sigma factor (sigma-70 family)